MEAPGVESIRPLRRAEYDQLIALGAFQDERIELLDGALVHMSPIGAPHSATVDRLTELLVIALVGRARIRVQGAFAAGEYSEPEPDLIVLPRADYDAAHPDRAHLIIEVAESSLKRDRDTKARLYAECGVPEYWIVNLQDRCVELHSEPAGGRYQRVERREPGGSLRLREFPDVELCIDDFLK